MPVKQVWQIWQMWQALLSSLLLLALVGFALSQEPLPKLQDKQQPEKKPEEKVEEKPDDPISPILVDTSVVVLNVTVTDFGENFVGGLKRSDFAILEDKFPQPIADFSVEVKPFAAAILIDASASMGDKMTLARSACTSFVDGLREDDVFAIYSFTGTKVKQVQDFSDIHDISDFLWDMRPDGMTPMYDALVKATEDLLKRPERRRVILLVSDGADSTSKATLDEVIRKATDVGITIYCVDLSDRGVYKTTPRDNGPEIMKNLAQKTGGRFYTSPGGGALREAFAQTVEELRHQYTITYEPRNEKKDGKWRAVEVQLKNPALKARTRLGYYAAKAKK
ncbi:MAG: VWA domain-containing protein [Acidobacteria bacterium]|nr:VWA domain-containing protein [Acidobacteriota bacterium]